MSDNKEKKIHGVTNEEPEIFGRSKSREEIKADRIAEKAAQKQAAKEARAAALAAAKNQPKDPERIREFWIIGGILLVVVAVCAILLAVQFHKDKEQEAFQQDETRASYFLDNDAAPELTDDGLNAAVTKIYYTNGGYLAVEMILGNGMDKPQHLDSIEVKLKNGETKKTIAAGFTDQVSEDYVVPAQGTNDYTFYISPEHIEIKDDPLQKISYSITATGIVIE